ncbi:hypothetical protein BDQ17DRAFT_1425302 [Cyathus striatus]|nr:hypothetical protein BDQ17DRAFT_1425302 [Cyathus striatus]
MAETRRLLEAAAALSRILREGNIPHAFHGSVFTAEIFCIVEYGANQTHPFRRVRDAVADTEDFTATLSPWTNRLHVSYRRPIPPVDIEILPAGEFGPLHLDNSTVMRIHDIPFLTVSEFIRAKLNNWVIRGTERDAQDIIYALSRYWNRVDINRIQEQDMNQFVARYEVAAPAWAAVRRKYGV